MTQEAQAVPEGMKIDPSMLRLYIDPLGPLHDETRSSIFRFAKKTPRAPVAGATLATSRFSNNSQLSECCNIMNTRNTALARCATSRNSCSISGTFLTLREIIRYCRSSPAPSEARMQAAASAGSKRYGVVVFFDPVKICRFWRTLDTTPLRSITTNTGCQRVAPSPPGPS